MKIDADHGIALRCHDRRVPAIGPAIVKRALRPAMDEQKHRQLARCALRLDDLAVDLVAIGPGEIELLVIDGIKRGDRIRVDVGQLGRFALCVHMDEVGRPGDAVDGIYHATIFERHGFSDAAAFRQARDSYLSGRCGKAGFPKHLAR